MSTNRPQIASPPLSLSLSLPVSLSRPRRSSSSLSLLVALAACLALASTAAADILWDDCTSEADHEPTKIGDFYNLCIDKHEFVGERFAWRLTKAKVRNTVFDNCYFENGVNVENEIRDSNFTETIWNAVTFKNSVFGSGLRDRDIVFDQTSMDNVEFINCTFHHSTNLVFNRFKAFNLSFTDCKFEGDTTFTMGEISSLSLTGAAVRRNRFITAESGKDSFLFNGVTIYGLKMRGCDFANPIRFESVNAADLDIENSRFNKFWCHSEPGAGGAIARRAQFNESIFQAVTFRDQVFCDQTRWINFVMGNTSFQHDADFSDSKILSINWDNVVSTTTTGDCRELDFSKTNIVRQVFANVTVECEANFQETTFETTLIRNFYGRRSNFEGAIFVRQEFVDRQCCSAVCVPLKCKCNVTEPSGNCPIGGPEVNVSAVSPICFPADAALHGADGESIAMADVRYNDPVAVGNGQHSNVYFFGHRDEHASAEFVAIRYASSRKPVRLSPQHYLYVNGRLQTADSVRPGDRLRDAHGRDALFVTEVTRQRAVGLYAPTSLHGDLLVDGVVASSYTAAVHPDTAHRLLAPVRMLYRAGLHGVVRRLTMLHERSLVHMARAVGLPAGPQFVH